MAGSARGTGWVMAGIVSAGVAALAALLLGVLFAVVTSHLPRLLWWDAAPFGLAAIPWLCLWVLLRLRKAALDPAHAAPPRWQAWVAFGLGGPGWAGLNALSIEGVLHRVALHPSSRFDLGDVGVWTAVALVPLPALLVLGGYCLSGRPLPPEARLDMSAV